MSIKISELTEATSVNSTDVLPIVQDGTTKKATVEEIRNSVATSITSSSTNDEVAGAKAVYDICGDVESVLQTLNSGSGV